jgi:D-alanyl-D-alanine carboxypeptidase
MLLACCMLPTLAWSATDKASSAAEALLRREVAADAPGASVLVARGDTILYEQARGLADVELGVPLATSQAFRIGSISKTFTAAAILKLSAAHRLSLDDPLSRYVPGFPNGAHITIAELLDHTAGISDDWNIDMAQAPDTASLIKAIESHAPDFPPGEGWAYSNSGYMLLGAVLEKITHKPWHQAIHDLLTGPLGLRDTDFFPDTALVPNRALGYSRDDSGAIVHPSYVNIAGPAAAGALTSNVEDLFHWMRALVSGRAIPASLFAQMSSAKSTRDGTPVHYGYGLMLGTVRGEPVIEHNGGIEGFASQLTYFPTGQVTVVVLSNTDAGQPNPRSLAHRLGAITIGRPYPALEAITPAPATLAHIAGSYRIDADATRDIAVDNGTLTMQRTHGPKRPIAIASGDRLFFPHDGTDYFQIVRDARGAVTALDYYAAGATREARVAEKP